MRLRLALALSAAFTTTPLVAQTTQPVAPAEAKQPFDKVKAEGVVQRLVAALEENFVFPDVGLAYGKRLREQLAAGAYARFPDGQAFAAKVTDDLQAVHKDGHLKLRVVPGAVRTRPAGERLGPPPGSAVVKAGWLSDGVAYIRFDGFPGNEATLAHVRKFLAGHRGASTLIIDARAHRGGGLAEMDILFPELFAKPTTLVAMDTREAVARREGNSMEGTTVRKIAAPNGVVRHEHFVTPAQQAGLAQAKVILLIAKGTVSAGEHLALSLKRTKRATLIGETTRGAGHYGSMVPLDDAFTYAAFIPVGRTFDPDTGKGWEGIGVEPDIAVPADEALDEALKLAGIQKTGETALTSLR